MHNDERWHLSIWIEKILDGTTFDVCIKLLHSISNVLGDVNGQLENERIVRQLMQELMSLFDAVQFTITVVCRI